MLLTQEETDGIEVLSVRGPVDDAEAPQLVETVERLLAHEPRGVVVDLTEALDVSDATIGELAALPSGWPRSALVVCPSTPLAALEGLLTAPDRSAAEQVVDARARRPRARFDLPHDLSGPAKARAVVHECASRLGLDEVRDDVTLLVSEMVTNAIRHAAPPVCLEIESSEQGVVVAVRDGSPVRPAPREVDADAEGGRGMLLVDLLTAAHGVRSQPPGKAVWALLSRPSRCS